jgi:hypothetical protein
MRRAINLKPRCFTLFVLALLFLLLPAAQAKTTADAYFGYSRVGANLYGPYTPGMNGWQFAMHVKPLPFVGFEGDVSHYSQSASNFTEHVTPVMFGPRVTVHAAGLSLFAHGLAGIAHQTATVTIYPQTGYDALSYALGAGADIPLFLGLKLRVTGDYLGNSKAPSSQYSPSHYRAGAGLAYHF